MSDLLGQRTYHRQAAHSLSTQTPPIGRHLCPSRSHLPQSTVHRNHGKIEKGVEKGECSMSKLENVWEEATRRSGAWVVGYTIAMLGVARAVTALPEISVRVVIWVRLVGIPGRGR